MFVHRCYSKQNFVNTEYNTTDSNNYTVITVIIIDLSLLLTTSQTYYIFTQSTYIKFIKDYSSCFLETTDRILKAIDSEQ